MKGGHNKKDIETLKQEGTYRNDRHGGALTLERLKAIPPAPPDFDAEHKKEWNRVCRLLIHVAGIMTAPDVESVRMYVELSIRAKKLFAGVCKTGATYNTKGGLIKANPAYDQYIKTQTLLLRLYERFAFDPRSRQALKVDARPTDDNDPLTAIFGKN